MIIHELATNSLSYGCLSAQTGKLDVSSRSDDENVVIVWAESGGPKVEGAPELMGFGSNYVSQTLSNQFQGALKYDWQPEGLVATLRMRSELLSD
ncbi:MAG TPA: sensor histidine kinase [Sphingomicrobium sp.]|jgi:two-component sensor histidine kinase|nr:sensor histidine kinase [Sphingomicrobium sp.]